MSTQAGSTVITLDRERRLRFDVNAIAAFEERFDNAPIHTILQPSKPVGLKTVRELLYAGLLHEDETMTPKRAGALLEDFLAKGGEFSAIVAPLTKAVESSTLLRRRDGDESPQGNAQTPAATGQ
ncbi:MAG: hypothetical protein FJ027_04365 [Candidatus Rokubacteria bacterium]|nr:hypothetical protein [Candidatus Rokubacteria bacterium]